MTQSTSRTASAIWTIPAVLFVVIVIGLAAALLGTGVWQWVSWICMTIAPVVAVWYGGLRHLRQ